MAGTKLGQGRPVRTGESGFGWVDGGRRGLEDFVVFLGLEVLRYCGGVDVFEDGFAVTRGNGAVRAEPLLNERGEFGLEGFDTGVRAGAGGEGSESMGGVRRLEGVGEKLGAEHIEMRLNGEEFGLGMEVGGASHAEATCNCPHGFVLDDLEGLDVGGAEVGVPNGAGV